MLRSQYSNGASILTKEKSKLMFSKASVGSWTTDATAIANLPRAAILRDYVFTVCIFSISLLRCMLAIS